MDEERIVISEEEVNAVSLEELPGSAGAGDAGAGKDIGSRGWGKYQYLAMLVVVALVAGGVAGWVSGQRQVASADHEQVVAPQGTGWRQQLAQRGFRGVVFISSVEEGWMNLLLGGSESIGTGVVIAKKGNKALILTNRHVIAGRSRRRLADRIDVWTASSKKLPYRVVGWPRDHEMDMALLLVEGGSELEVMGDIGAFASVRTGEDVVAIGHPGGFEFTMTDGIVSACRKGGIIQCSASINPGNSGGPLLDSRGRIIGVNTFIMRNLQGQGFALRADVVVEQEQWELSPEALPLLEQVVVRR